MNIIKVEKFTNQDLISKLRNVSLMQNPEIKPYENTIITLEKININSLSPTQKYLMNPELEKVKNLYKELKKHDVDLYNLNGYVDIYLEGYNTPISVLPIIVEESIEENGEVHLIVNDGMHRSFYAKQLNIIPQVAYIRGVNTEKYPYYAYPLENSWNTEFDFLDNIPEGYIKKQYRWENFRFLYRDFNSQFNNTSGMRK